MALRRGWWEGSDDKKGDGRGVACDFLVEGAETSDVRSRGCEGKELWLEKEGARDVL